MRSYWICFFVFALGFNSESIFAQRPLSSDEIFGDTLNISLLAQHTYLTCEATDTLFYKESFCRTISLKNDLSAPVLIDEIRAGNNNDLYVKTQLLIPSTGLVLMPGEIVPAVKGCYEHLNPPTDAHLNFTLVLEKFSSGGSTFTYRNASYYIYLKRDSLLQFPCFESKFDSLIFDPVIIGGSSQRQLTLKSNRKEPVIVSAISSSVDANSFIYSPSFPLAIPPLGTVTVPISYHPLDSGIVKYRHGMLLKLSADWDGSSCSSGSWTLAGTAIPPTADSIATPLFPDEKQILAFVGAMQPTIKTFHFTNNTSGNLKIISVSMKNGTSFRINNVTPSNTFPFDLAAGANMTVDVEMLDVSQGVHYDELIIVVDKAADALHFELQGLQKEKALSVRSPAQNNVELMIYPNPTSGSTTFSLNGATSGKLEIVDVLGNTLYRTQFDNIHVWNDITARNTKLPAGSYIARVHSLDAANPFTASKIFIVQ